MKISLTCIRNITALVGAAVLLAGCAAQRSPDLLEEMGYPPDEPLLGVYWGVPLNERSATEPPLYPDTIYIFKGPLEEMCASLEELEEEIEITVVHEVAHFVGFNEEQLRELGYE
jgi:predicted Zn-dependent protease with MMP-like domain